MFGCFVALFSLISPRLALVAIWLLTDLYDRVFDSLLPGIVGFIFLPYTTIMYLLVYNTSGISTVGWILLIFALIVDLGSYKSGYSKKRHLSGWRDSKNS